MASANFSVSTPIFWAIVNNTFDSGGCLSGSKARCCPCLAGLNRAIQSDRCAAAAFTVRHATARNCQQDRRDHCCERVKSSYGAKAVLSNSYPFSDTHDVHSMIAAIQSWRSSAILINHPQTDRLTTHTMTLTIRFVETLVFDVVA